MKRVINRIKPGNRRGQSLIEFSLVMPMFFVLFTGMLAFGIALHDCLVLTNGVNISAQTLAMSRGQTTDPCATAWSAIRNAGTTLTPSRLSITVVLNGTSYSSTSCTSGAGNMVQGAAAQVSATYPCSLAIFGMTFPSCSLGAQLVETIQ